MDFLPSRRKKPSKKRRAMIGGRRIRAPELHTKGTEPTPQPTKIALRSGVLADGGAEHS